MKWKQFCKKPNNQIDEGEKNMKGFFKNFFKNKEMMMKVAVSALVLMTVASPAFASDAGLDKLDNLIDVIAKWLGRIGLIVAFFGGVQTALGFKNDDADGKIRGLRTLAAGFLVFGLTESLSLFGL